MIHLRIRRVSRCRVSSGFEKLSWQGDGVEDGEAACCQESDGHPLGGRELAFRQRGDANEDLWHSGLLHFSGVSQRHTVHEQEGAPGHHQRKTKPDDTGSDESDDEGTHKREAESTLWKRIGASLQLEISNLRDSHMTDDWLFLCISRELREMKGSS